MFYLNKSCIEWKLEHILWTNVSDSETKSKHNNIKETELSLGFDEISRFIIYNEYLIIIL